MSNKDKNRRKAMFYYKLLQSFYNPLVWMFTKTKFYHEENLIKDSKVIYVCNHTSAYDCFMFFTKFFRRNKINILAKAEIFSNIFKGKFLNKILLEGGVIPIHRGEADINSIKRVLNAVKNDEPVFMFPEGTRNKGDVREFLEFKQGAALFAIKADAPIIPVVYSGKTGFFKKTSCNIGKPFYLNEFNGKCTKANLIEGTKIIYDNMKATQKELFDIIEAEQK